MAVMVVVALVVEQRAETAPSQQVVVTTTTKAAKPILPPITRDLVEGVEGEDVRNLQVRLAELKFAPGPIDGVYGRATVQAVWAFEKLVMQVPREKATGVVTPAMWEVMRGDVQILPRRVADTPRHAEVYLPEQVIITFLAGKPTLISHMSSGDGKPWCEEVVIDAGEEGNDSPEQIAAGEQLKIGVCGESITPPGIFTFYKRSTGTRETKLGTLYNPVYFNAGIAVHGAILVPLKPASHGCIRIPMSVATLFPSMVQFRDRIYVFDGIKEPEEYGSPLPPADRPDPNYTTVPTSTTLPVSSTLPTPTTVPVSPTVPTSTTLP
ncbi:MAG: peptidoglycan-binding protein [Ilumatobacteraceae bacterium]|jgi:peptidoglycan hydrolase-like protein with peptidoglycan-binding domain